MTALTDFLLARIAEDEEVARLGISGQEDPENGWGYEGRALTPHVGIIHEAAQAAHITRWHPARVIAECTAKRWVVEHAATAIDQANRANGRDTHDVMVNTKAITSATVLHHLVQVYSDHPHFNQAWRMP